MLRPPPTPFTPCRCPEANLFRQILCGEIPAADSPMWRALLALVDGAASYRLRHIGTDPAIPVPPDRIGVPFTELEQRRAELRCPVRCPACGRHRTVWPPPAVVELACERCRPTWTVPAPWPGSTRDHRTEAA